MGIKMRLTAMVLSLAMVFTLLPQMAWAEEDATGDGVDVTNVVTHEVGTAAEYNSAITAINSSDVTEHIISLTDSFEATGKITGFTSNHTTIIGNGYYISNSPSNNNNTHIVSASGSDTSVDIGDPNDSENTIVFTSGDGLGGASEGSPAISVTSSATVTIHKGATIKNFSPDSGEKATIYVYGATLNILGGVITNNETRNGSNPSMGVVYLYGSTLYMDGGEISNCIDNRSVGSLTSTYASALTARYSDVTIKNATFSNNIENEDTPNAAYGGAIYYNSKSSNNLIIEDTVFENNTANKGGAIYAACYSGSTADISISGCTFTNNDAIGQYQNSYSSASYSYGLGGAVWVQAYSGGQFSMEDCTFTGCDADYGGAAYVCYGTNTTTIDDCDFEESSASYYGGGLYMLYADSKITDCTFTENEASLGGGLMTYGCDAVITDSDFTKNEADGGGGIYGYGYELSLLGDTSITGNYGEGVYLDTYTTSFIIDDTVTVKDNGYDLYDCDICQYYPADDDYVLTLNITTDELKDDADHEAQIGFYYPNWSAGGSYSAQLLTDPEYQFNITFDGDSDANASNEQKVMNTYFFDNHEGYYLADKDDEHMVLKPYPVVNYNINLEGDATADVVDEPEAKPYYDIEFLGNDSTNFTNSGYNFASWNTEADGTGTTYTAGDVIVCDGTDITLYAQWTDHITVTYNANGGTGSTTDSTEYQTAAQATILANSFTAPDGKYFTGWNTEADGSGTDYSADDKITIADENITLYAQWLSYSNLTYDANGGEGSVTDTNEYKYLDVADVAVNEFTYTGYAFVSWNTKADGTGSTYFPKGTYTFTAQDRTLYAIWAEVEDEEVEETTGNDLDADGTHTEYIGDVETMMDYPHPEDFEVVDKETGDVLEEYVDYEVTLHTHLPGHTTAWVTGIGTYDGDSDEVDYIIRQDIADYNSDGRGGIDNSIYWGNIQREYAYTGNPIEPIDFVTSIIGELTEGEDYTVEYEDITPESVTYMSLMRNSTSLLYNASGDTSKTTDVGTKQATITGIGDVFYGEIVLTYDVVNAITNHAHSMEYQYSFEYDGDPLADEMIATIVVTETTADGKETVLDPAQYTVTFDSTEDDYTTHPGYVNFTVHVNDCEHYLYGTMIIMKDISNDGYDDYIGGVDDTVYIMDDSITTDFAGAYADLADLYLMDAETDGYMRFLNKEVEGTSYYNFTIYRDGDYVVFDADENTTDCFYGKMTIYMPEISSSSGSSSNAGTLVTPDTTAVTTLNKDDHFAYMQGYPDSTFRAAQNITRAETVVMFARLLTEQMDETGTYSSDFDDMDGSEWFYNQVGYMTQLGIVTGYTDGTFGGTDYITRAEFATIASRFDALSHSDTDLFSDIAGHWAEDYINSAATKGWVNGYNDGTFCPDQYITRAEVVTLVNRMLERNCDEDFADTYWADLVQFIDLNDTYWAYYNIVEATNAHDYTKDANGNETWSALTP